MATAPRPRLANLNEPVEVSGWKEPYCAPLPNHLLNPVQALGVFAHFLARVHVVVPKLVGLCLLHKPGSNDCPVLAHASAGVCLCRFLCVCNFQPAIGIAEETLKVAGSQEVRLKDRWFVYVARRDAPRRGELPELGPVFGSRHTGRPTLFVGWQFLDVGVAGRVAQVNFLAAMVAKAGVPNYVERNGLGLVFRRRINNDGFAGVEGDGNVVSWQFDNLSLFLGKKNL